MAKLKDSFSAGEATRITGVPYRTLDLWARTKFIVPSIADSAGIGSERRYNFSDLLALRVAIELRQGGISTQALRRVIERLREWKRSDEKNILGSSHLVVTGADVHLVNDHDQVLNLLRKPGQSVFAFMVDLGRTAQETQKRALEPSRPNRGARRAA